MSKLDQYMRGRTEGMEFALRLAKDKGIEELEKEVRFRNRAGVSLNLTRQEIAAGSDKIKNMTFDTMLAMSLMTLRDEFTFGKKRLERFKDRFAEKAASLAEDYCTWLDIVDVLKEETGIDLEIRWNDKKRPIRSLKKGATKIHIDTSFLCEPVRSQEGERRKQCINVVQVRTGYAVTYNYMELNAMDIKKNANYGGLIRV